MAPSPPRAARRLELTLFALLAAAAGWLLFRQAARLDALFVRQPAGYYGLLVDGFRHGHLYAEVQPHPQLLALADPYDPVANAPYRVHDLSLYRGHYYLYFGVTPVLIFFWPIGALTGWYPTQICAIAAFCFLGFVAGLALLAAFRRRFFPSAPVWSLALGGVCLVGANPVWSLSQEAAVYNVPIACAFALAFAFWGALYRALHGSRRRIGWLAAASLLYGLLIGARPDYLLFGLVLAAAAAWLRRAGLPRRPLLWAAGSPALACGLGLALYNLLRFGSVFEFGMRYQLAGESHLHFQPLSLVHLWPNGSAYLFATGAWQGYFPFFSAPADAGYGLLRYLPWLWLVPLAFLRPLPSRPDGTGGARRLPALILAGWAANFLLLSCFFFGTNLRYQTDHAPALFLLAAIGCLAAAARVSPGPRRTACGLLAAAVTACSLALNGSALVARDPQAANAVFPGRLLDHPAAWLERRAGRQYGPLAIDWQPPDSAGPLAEPIFETGLAPDRRDWLQLTRLPGDRAQLGFFHAGAGLVVSRPFALPAGGRLSIEAQCGSLLPPFAHPAFADWSPDDYAAAKRELRLKVGGVEVLHTALDCYPSAPGDLSVGSIRWPADGVADRLSGRILSQRRLALERPSPPPALRATGGLIELRLAFPADRGSGTEPVLATGHGQQADLLTCIYEGPGRLRLALDHADSGGARSDLLAFDPAKPSVLRVWLGSLAGPPPREETPDLVPPRRRLFVTLDGAIALNSAARFTPDPAGSIVLGRNPFASTDVAGRFSGLVLGAAADPGKLPPLEAGGAYGAVELELLFPAQALGMTEPLAVTGATGAGDIVYIRYDAADRVSFGFDHWGVGGITGPPVAVDYGQIHRIRIAMASLFPPGRAGTWAHRVQVTLDGAVVLEGNSDCHPSERDEIHVGQNPIGGSTCGPAFTGQIIRSARTPAQPDR